MGVFAVQQLLKGNSNIVICEKNNEIEAVDINYALILDRMYKGKLVEGDLDKFSKEDVEKMKSEIAERRRQMEKLYDISNTINI
jgi:hypothetical protein